MKKNILLALVVICFTSQAPDTLHMLEPARNYFYDSWGWDLVQEARRPDDTVAYTWYGFGPGWGLKYMAYRMITDEPLTIYGIAVSPSFSDYYLYRDSIADSEFYEYLYIFEVNKDRELSPVGDSVKINGRTDSADYYVDFAFRSCWPDMGVPAVKPYAMVEKYFDAPVTVADSFFIGQSNRLGSGLISEYADYTWDFGIAGFNPCVSDGYAVEFAWYGDSSTHVSHWNDESYFKWQYGFEASSGGRVLLFPILTPRDSSDTSHTSIGTAADDHLASLKPNPARDQTEVQCSYGIRHIDVADAAGRTVASFDASGYRTLIDTSRWLKGTYIVRIHTVTGGIVVRKLLVE